MTSVHISIDMNSIQLILQTGNYVWSIVNIKILITPAYYIFLTVGEGTTVLTSETKPLSLSLQYQAHVTQRTWSMGSSLQPTTWAPPSCCRTRHRPRTSAWCRHRRPSAASRWSIYLCHFGWRFNLHICNFLRISFFFFFKYWKEQCHLVLIIIKWEQCCERVHVVSATYIFVYYVPSWSRYILVDRFLERKGIKIQSFLYSNFFIIYFIIIYFRVYKSKNIIQSYQGLSLFWHQKLSNPCTQMIKFTKFFSQHLGSSFSFLASTECHSLPLKWQNVAGNSFI